MSEKFLKVGANGEYAEALGYLTSEFINSSAGAGDAGKPVVLNASGLLDATMVNAGSISHDGTSGMAASTGHTAFPLLNGTRPFTAAISYSSHPSFSSDTELVDKKYVDDVASTLEWQDSVLTAGTLTPPGSPSTGDRYLINGTGLVAWVGKDNQIAEWDGTAWVYTIPTTGMRVGADDEPSVAFYLYGGASWAAKYVESTTASTGLVKVGYDIRIDASAGGAGLGFAAGVLSVNVDDSSIEITTDTLNVKALGITDAMLAGSISDGKLTEDYIKTSEVDDSSIEFSGGSLNVKADGINDLMIDFGTGANQVSAADIPIADAGGFTATTEVESSLQELYGLIDQSGVEYTVGVGGVTKGDVVYISANDTILPYGTITTFHKAIGLANATVAAAATVRSLANDTVLENVISGATAGTVYYWDGSSLVSSIPTTSAAYIIQAGVAKNATDLAVECRPVKKNI